MDPTTEPLGWVQGVLAEQMAHDHIPGAAAVVVRDGAVATTVALGMADSDRGVPFSTTATVALGPLTRLLTTVAVLRLVSDGLLHLDDLVIDVISGSEPYGGRSGQSLGLGGNPMTVASLLTPRPTRHPAGTVHRFGGNRRHGRLAGPPGSPWINDVDRMATLISAVSGERFETFMAKEVLGPAEMWSASFPRVHVLPSSLVAPGRRRSAGIGARTLVGSAECTPADLGRFLAAVSGGGTGPAARVVDPRGLTLMVTPSAPLPAPGLGVWLECHDARVVAHTGEPGGARSGGFACFAPGTGAAVGLILRRPLPGSLPQGDRSGPAGRALTPGALAVRILAGVLDGHASIV
ncbi:MAG: serine hydrolase domain-containing protein [Acidimicrobiia bacterium]